MPIAAHDLGRRGVRGQPERVEHVTLDRSAHVGMRADRSRDRADRDPVARARQALGVALQLGVPAGGLETEGDRLGVDAVASPDHRGVAVLEHQAMHDLDQAG